LKTGVEAYIYHLSTDTQKLNNKNIVENFVKSFSPDIREKLLNYYSCDVKWLMENVYDTDELIEAVICQNENLSDISYTKDSGKSVKLIAGYNAPNIGTYKLFKKEIPAYYLGANLPGTNDQIIRPAYLYEHTKEILGNSQKALYFLTRNRPDCEACVDNPDKKFSGFVLSKYDDAKYYEDKDVYRFYCYFKGEEWYIDLTNRSDANALTNRGTVSALKWKKS
jgi:hypothetical protein